MRFVVLMAVGVGCSGGHDLAPDGSPDGPAASCPQAGPGTVHVHPLVAAATILTHDASGAFSSRIETTSTDVVDVQVPPCGAITLVASPSLYETTTDLVDGDELYALVQVQPSPTSTTRVIVDSPLANVTNYLASAGCGGGQGAVDVALTYRQDCVDAAGRATVVVFPYSVPPTPFAYALFEDVVLADPLHVTAWTTDAPHHQITFELDKPPGYTHCSANSMRGSTGFIGSGIVQQPVDPTPTTVDVQFAEFGDGYGFLCSATNESTRYYWKSAAGALPAALTLREADFVPDIVPAPLEGDGTRVVVVYNVMPSTSDEDLVMMEVGGTGASGAFALWRLFAPPGTRRGTVPEVPDDLKIAFTTESLQSIRVFESTDAAGYREAVRNTVRFYIGAPGGEALRTFRWTEWRRQ